MFNKKTIKDVDLHEKRVLLRADYNVPVGSRGVITGDYRIKQSLPTIKFLLEQNAKVVICSHLGRPGGKPDRAYSLEPVAGRLSEMLGIEVQFAGDCIGSEALRSSQNLQPGQILLLENLRFHPGEKEDDDSFAAELAKHGELFVQDGFGVVHRKHASTDAITRCLPSVAGLLLEKEVNTIASAMDSPKRPLATIIGGAKISDKIDVLNRFVEIADVVAVGGAMANTFLAAQGIKIGKSKHEPEAVETAREIIERAAEKSAKQKFTFYIPQDGVVARAVDKSSPTRVVDWNSHFLSEAMNYPRNPSPEMLEVGEDEMILDIGPVSASFINGALQLSQTVVWNGTLGVTETSALNGPVGPFAHGTEAVIEGLMGDYGAKPYTVVGGGDTASYIEGRMLTNSFDWVSTGGGASLDLMAGKNLPGVESLRSK